MQPDEPIAGRYNPKGRTPNYALSTTPVPMTSPPADRPANRLQHETSPYLLQHARNPVHWYPWGAEALDQAKKLDRPIFLSVGYSACHWCHVMEHESFENERIAAQMNEQFINIKVDREERPDIDQIYMAAVQALSGHGGWPMSVFLTPDTRPFFAGTYFPPDDRRGMAGFPRVLSAVADAWANRRDEVVAGAARLTEELQSLGAARSATGALDFSLLDGAFRALSRAFDAREGGFGDAPKFPHPMDLRVLLRHFARTGDSRALGMTTFTLDKMARGGIFDHLGGGFARYSTDARWLVPHFEKMLYDNALIASTYIEAYQITGDASFEATARATLDYVLDRMTGPDGGVYATEDADSEGVEGKFYVWTLDEIERLLGPERARTFAAVYDVTARGNWEHKNILNLPAPIAEAAEALGRNAGELSAELAESRAVLLAAREERVPPGKDTKVIAAWNGLIISAWAVAGAVLGDERYLVAARNAARFALKTLRGPDGRLWHSFKDGRPSVAAFLDDYACLCDGLMRLFEATGKTCWLDAAVELANHMLSDFREANDGGFYYTSQHGEPLIVRARDATDNATPSGNGMAATALLRLGALTGRDDLERAGAAALESARGIIAGAPMAAGQSLIALDFLLGNRQELALFSGSDASEFRTALQIVSRRFAPGRVLAPRLAVEPDNAADSPLFAGRSALDDRVTAYVCERYACAAPLVGLDAITAEFSPKIK